MKKVQGADVTWHDVKNHVDVTFEIHTETNKAKKTTGWYIKDTRSGKFVNKKHPFETRPSVTDVLLTAGAKSPGY